MSAVLTRGASLAHKPLAQYNYSLNPLLQRNFPCEQSLAAATFAGEESLLIMLGSPIMYAMLCWKSLNSSLHLSNGLGMRSLSNGLGMRSCCRHHDHCMILYCQSICMYGASSTPWGVGTQSMSVLNLSHKLHLRTLLLTAVMCTLMSPHNQIN